MAKILKFPIQTKSLQHIVRDYRLMLNKRKKTYYAQDGCYKEHNRKLCEGDVYTEDKKQWFLYKSKNERIKI